LAPEQLRGSISVSRDWMLVWIVVEAVRAIAATACRTSFR
jgi:hypothetical protein